MFLSLAFAVVLAPAPHTVGARSTPRFTKPSESYAFVQQPIEEWEAAVKAGKRPRTHLAPSEEVLRRAKTWCPAFSVDGQSGEELYYLGLLCREALDWQKATAALERYLSGEQQAHGPKARLLLAATQRSGLQESWQILLTVFQEDPIDSHQEWIARDVIDEESEKDQATGLAWAEEHYSRLRARAQNRPSSLPEVSYGWVAMAGTDLVHLYYLAGKAEQAQEVLAELNHFKDSHSDQVQGLAFEQLEWANMELHPAPSIPLLKTLGRDLSSGVIQKGRVEVISFFFLGCAPCLVELPGLNALQRRYQRDKLLVADVTSYKVNSYLEPPTHTAIEAALNKTRHKKAPDLTMVVTTDEALKNYNVVAFPEVVIIDKASRVRYVGRDIEFEEDDPLGRLLRKLIAE